MTDRLERLKRVLDPYPSVIVAYSGGVDSATLAVVTHRLKGDAMRAVLSASPSLPPFERAAAEEFAKKQGFPLRVIETQELANPLYQANNPDRCYHCKSTLYAALAEIRREVGPDAVIVNGTNLDDLGDYRPGLQAAKEQNVLSPFVDARMTKEDVRALARELGLSVWNKPAAACLASRLPYGTSVTLERLDQVGRAEWALMQRGFSGARVRHHDSVARLEVRPEDLPRALELRHELVSALKEVGYRYVTLDLEGYRTGSHNEVLPHES